MNDRPTITIHGFKTTYEMSYDPETNKPTGKMDRPVDWVMYSPLHMAMYSQITERVEFLRPPEHMKNDDGGIKLASMNHKWSMIEPAYKAWKSGQEIPIGGTPLGVWPGINEGQAAVFRAAGIKTVEQVASMPETIINRVALPGVRDLVKQAAAFLEATDRSSTANRLNDQSRQIEALQEQLAAAMELLEQQTKTRKRAKEEAEAA
jgi:hypothetical protein